MNALAEDALPAGDPARSDVGRCSEITGEWLRGRDLNPRSGACRIMSQLAGKPVSAKKPWPRPWRFSRFSNLRASDKGSHRFATQSSKDPCLWSIVRNLGCAAAIAPGILAKADVEAAFLVLQNVNAIARHSPASWLRGRDLNPRPSGYEPDELPGCSTPRLEQIMRPQGANATANRHRSRFAFAVEWRRIPSCENASSTKKSRTKSSSGTASWSDPGFVERWYPKKMPAGDRLAWYAQHFEMVEVNSTFYAVPDVRMVERWCRTARQTGSCFDVKLHQLLSRHSTNVKVVAARAAARARGGREGQSELNPEIEAEMSEEFRHADLEICANPANWARFSCSCRRHFRRNCTNSLGELDACWRARGIESRSSSEIEIGRRANNRGN